MIIVKVVNKNIRCMNAIKSFVIAVLTAMVMMGCKEYVPVDTFIEAADPVSLTPEQEAAWADVSGKLNVAWGSPDVQYARSIVPEDVSNEPFRIKSMPVEPIANCSLENFSFSLHCRESQDTQQYALFESGDCFSVCSYFTPLKQNCRRVRFIVNC